MPALDVLDIPGMTRIELAVERIWDAASRLDALSFALHSV
jgi:hypothetical protein